MMTNTIFIKCNIYIEDRPNHPSIRKITEHLNKYLKIIQDRFMIESIYVDKFTLNRIKIYNKSTIDQGIVFHLKHFGLLKHFYNDCNVILKEYFGTLKWVHGFKVYCSMDNMTSNMMLKGEI